MSNISRPKAVYDATEEMMSPKKRYLQNARESAKRMEVNCYKFSPTRAVLSRELSNTLAAKLEVFRAETERGAAGRGPGPGPGPGGTGGAGAAAGDTAMTDDRAQWSDRLGLLAKPLSSDVLLMCERGPDTLHASARFFLDELVNPARPPDARSRFPFDDIAIRSSKSISKMVSRYYAKKVYSASMIQRNYRFYRFRMKSAREAKERHLMANRLQFFVKKSKWRMQAAAREKWRVACLVVKAQAMVRRALARMAVARKVQDYKMRRVVLMHTWATKCIRRWRQHRGKAKRELGQVRKIQAVVRGRNARKFKWSVVVIQTRLLRWWKRLWLRKYGDRARQLLLKLRNSLWTRDIRRVQTFVRQFLARIKVARTRSGIYGRERQRVHGEAMALERGLTRARLHPDMVGWTWDVFQGWDTPSDTSSAGSGGSKKSERSGKASSKGSGAGSAQGSENIQGSARSDASDGSGGTAAMVAAKARELQAAWGTPRDYVEEFLLLDEQAHRVLEGHQVGFMPALVHEAFRPFFPGNAVPLSERITAATLLCFMDMPGGLLDAGALEVLVNSTAHLGPRHTSTAQAIAGDRALHRKREANLHTIAHNVHLEKVEKKKKLHAQLASEDLDPHGVHGGGVHHHHQHVTTLGGSAVGGKRIVAQAKTRTKRNKAGSIGAQVDVLGEHYALKDKRVAQQLEEQKKAGALASRLTEGAVNTPSLRNLALDSHHRGYERRRGQAVVRSEAKALPSAHRHTHAHTHAPSHHLLEPIPKPSRQRLLRAMECARAPTLKNTLCASVWAAAPRQRWQDAGALRAVAAPSRALLLRVRVSSAGPSVHLPDTLLHQAALVRRWFQHCIDVLQMAVETYREEGEGANQPRRVCRVCGEGFAVDTDLRTHAEKGCLGRAAVLGWVSKETLAPTIAQLVARVGNMPSTKTFSRKYKSISSSKYERTPPPPTRDISDVKVTLFGSSASDDGSGSLVSISTGDDGTPRHRAKTRTTTVKVGGGGGGDGSAPSSPLSAASGDADDDDDEEYDDDDDDDEEYADDDDAREEDGAGATGAAAAPAAVPAPRADVPADVVDAAHFMTSA